MGTMHFRREHFVEGSPYNEFELDSSLDHAVWMLMGIRKETFSIKETSRTEKKIVYDVFGTTQENTPPPYHKIGVFTKKIFDPASQRLR